MRRLILVVALLGAATLFASTAGAHGSRPMRHGRPCHRLYTVAMAQRAARAVYAGTRHPSRAERHMLGRLARCQRNPRASKVAGRLERAQREAWKLRLNPFNTAEVSWYSDAGQTASGFHSYYGVASCGSSGLCYSFGTKVEFCNYYDRARCQVAVVDDHGPYVGNREWDLNQNTAGAIGFGGLGAVLWRIVR